MSSVILASLYEKYQNILLCLGKEYRKWELLDDEYDQTAFDKHMNTQKYVMHLAYNPEDEKFVYVALFHVNSPYLTKTETFRKFLDILINKNRSKQDMADKQKFLEQFIDVDDKRKSKIISRILTENKKSVEAVFITKRELTTYFVRNIQIKYKHFNLVVHNYLHKHFIVDISKAPLCARHTRLSKTESVDLLSCQLMTSPYNLPRIFINDPHIIWCGGKVGEIIRIEVDSEMAGKSIRYRIVVPLSGKVQTSDILAEEEVDDLEDEDSQDEEDEEVQDEEGVHDQNKEDGSADEAVSDADDDEDFY
jgi:DNA-directed RNA polymerase subunit H (RpoH/RPB5)